MRVNDKINSIADEIMNSAQKLLKSKVQEETGKKIEILSLSPFRYRIARDRVHNLESVLHNTRLENYKIYMGREAFSTQCKNVGMGAKSYKKEVTYNGRKFKIVGVYRNTASWHLVIMGNKGGLYLVKSDNK